MMFQPGQSVMWTHEQRGGYGYVEHIPGAVVRVTPRRVTIRVSRRDGSVVERSVKPEHLRSAQAVAFQIEDECDADD